MADLQVKLDWFSFTFPITLLGDTDNETTVLHIRQALELHAGSSARALLRSPMLTWQSGRGFYTHSLRDDRTLVSINWSAGNPYAQCVLSGQACDVVLQSISTDALLSLANGRCTRLDIATDIETGITPADFVSAGYSPRILSHSSVTSPSGQTEYVGSRAGERMARVYRYNPPHPRAALLRIEVELKGDAAKMTCEAGQVMELSKLAQATNLTFDWQHPIWKDGEIMVSKIPARPYDREGADSILWLDKQVAPAIRRMHHLGLIDIKEWLSEHFHDLLP